MRDPFKVMIWGPGGLGIVAAWEALQSKSLELVGVRAYSESKNGVDIGEMIGIGPVGIKATTDVESLMAIDCDCIIYTARDMGNFNTDEEVLQLLAAGKNVVTPLPYHNTHLFREPEFVEKLANACKQGGSVFHATGIDPDVVSNRILLSLTSACTDIKYLKLQENWECSGTDEALLAVAGFGKSLKEAAEVPMAAAVSTNFLKAIAYTVEQMLGVKYDRVEETHDYYPTPKDIDSTIFCKAGTVGRVTHRFKGFVDSKGAEPFFTMEYNWVMGHDMLPDDVSPNEYWVAIIEGRPSMRMAVDVKTSMETREHFYKIGKLRTEPGYHATIAPCLLAIPLICDASPGVLPSFGPGLNWKDDLRN